MNKITSTLAGIAIVAAASIVPASAQAFLPSNSGTFSFVGADSFSLTGISTKFVDFSTGTITSGIASVTGGINTPALPNVYSGATLTFSNPAFTDSGDAVLTFTGGKVTVSSGTGFKDAFKFTATAPVPEASTVVSFGALLALGGLAVLRRKSVKNAA